MSLGSFTISFPLERCGMMSVHWDVGHMSKNSYHSIFGLICGMWYIYLGILYLD